MTWSARTESLDAHTDRLVIARGDATLSFAEVIELWRTDEAFARFWTEQLARTRFRAVFWETPPITRVTVQRDFECVLVDAHGLAEPDHTVFAAHFDPAREVVTFANLGGDAVLVVPCPRAPEAAYGHLAAFVRGAPDQAIELWRQVGAAVLARLSTQPLWLSTAGLGVAWLHVRLDSRPKYYRHAPYKKS